MLMNRSGKSGTAAPTTTGIQLPLPTVSPVQKVVIVSATTNVLELLETALHAGCYDVVLVGSAENAYSQIKREQPDLVILYTPMSDVHAFNVLSMLKLDPATRAIPVITYTTEFEAEADEDEDQEDDGGEFDFTTAKPALWMN
ncbi:MAG TPA: hypothetical protein VJP86_05105 [Vicinamibacterales bacterium]|jgi:CheY-like chemotaxis protein|nr:hypothetical protein [Vicinamibacterales bacterium]